MRVFIWKIFRIFLISVISFLILKSVPAAEASLHNIVWKDVSSGIMDFDLQAVAVKPDDADVVYAGSSGTLYKTLNGGKVWKEVLSFRSTGNAITSIAISPLNTNVIYIGTYDGLFMSDDGGLHWKRIFSAIGDLDSSVLSIAVNPVNPEVIFIGTKSGLFWTDNGGRGWIMGQNLPYGVAVSSIVINYSRANIIYASTSRGIYKSIDNCKRWKRIFKTYTYMDDLDNNEDNGTSNQIESLENNEIGRTIRGIALDPADTSTVYVNTKEGLRVTEDEGLTWEILSNSGLLSNDIRHLVISPADPESLYAATNRGVFRYSKISDRWLKLYKGITANDIRYLAFAPSNQDSITTLWAVTNKGVFKTTSPMQNAYPKNREMDAYKVFSYFAEEPSIEEIMKAAIKYAEVHPEKIEGWRKSASKRAWLPDLKVAYDRDKDRQRSDYFYSGTYRGDDTSDGNDWQWSISLTWELGDIIWNNDQTSIDTRSRLMVQLRDDVLNEVTRLYFERRNLQIDMLLYPPEDIRDRIEKELRLQELTAEIDALTGFYLSRRLNQVKGSPR